MNEENIKSNMIKFLNTWHWQCFHTFNFSKNNNFMEKLKQWRIKLCTNQNIQIAYMGVIVENIQNNQNNHIHLLSFGRSKDNKTLFDVSTNVIDKYFNGDCLTSHLITDEERNNRVNYILKLENNGEWLTPYNAKLLEKKG